MIKCTFCGRQGDKTRFVGGYEILDVCTDCEIEILKEDFENES